ncbi:hypothetical protein ACJX0J_025871, partial [Zea mays]
TVKVFNNNYVLQGGFGWMTFKWISDDFGWGFLILLISENGMNTFHFNNDDYKNHVQENDDYKNHQGLHAAHNSLMHDGDEQTPFNDENWRGK